MKLVRVTVKTCGAHDFTGTARREDLPEHIVQALRMSQVTDEISVTGEIRMRVNDGALVPEAYNVELSNDRLGPGSILIDLPSAIIDTYYLELQLDQKLPAPDSRYADPDRAYQSWIDSKLEDK